MSDQTRPVPAIDADSAPFWAAARDGRLSMQRCSTCHRMVFYPRAICPFCMSDELDWIDLSGRGTVYSYTVVHKAPPGFADEVPYVVALVDLDEGVRMMSRVVDCSIERVAVGIAVQVVFRALSDDASLPCFTPVAG